MSNGNSRAPSPEPGHESWMAHPPRPDAPDMRVSRLDDGVLPHACRSLCELLEWIQEAESPDRSDGLASCDPPEIARRAKQQHEVVERLSATIRLCAGQRALGLEGLQAKKLAIQTYLMVVGCSDPVLSPLITSFFDDFDRLRLAEDQAEQLASTSGGRRFPSRFGLARIIGTSRDGNGRS